MNFKLTEKVILNLMKEEYDNRIFNFLFELQDSYDGVIDGKESQIDVLAGAVEAKVKHKETGYIFTINSVYDDKVILNLPDEPRLKRLEGSKDLVYEVEGEERTFKTSGELMAIKDKEDLEDERVEDKTRSDNAKCLVIDREEFKKEFSIE